MRATRKSALMCWIRTPVNRNGGQIFMPQRIARALPRSFLIDPTRCDMDRRYPARAGNAESPRVRRGPHRLVRPGGDEQNRSDMAIRIAVIGIGARAHIAQHARSEERRVGKGGSPVGAAAEDRK